MKTPVSFPSSPLFTPSCHLSTEPKPMPHAKHTTYYELCPQHASLTPRSFLPSCSTPSLSMYQVPGDGRSLHTLSSTQIPQKQAVVPRAGAQL